MAAGIVTAAGAGSRLGLEKPKFEAEILGKPIIAYSLMAFEKAGSIGEVVLVVPAGRRDDWLPARMNEMGFTKVSATIAGGETRQESVRMALEAVRAAAGTVVVHDGARPMVTPEMIESVSMIPEGFQGVIAAAPVIDTVKVVEAGVVVSTLDRDSLVAVQTPQAFDIEVLRRAHASAAEEGFAATDDAALVERSGGRVAVVPGHSENFKVTYPGDLDRVAAILTARSIR